MGFLLLGHHQFIMPRVTRTRTPSLLPSKVDSGKGRPELRGKAQFGYTPHNSIPTLLSLLYGVPTLGASPIHNAAGNANAHLQPAAEQGRQRERATIIKRKGTSRLHTTRFYPYSSCVHMGSLCAVPSKSRAGSLKTDPPLCILYQNVVMLVTLWRCNSCVLECSVTRDKFFPLGSQSLAKAYA